MLMLIVEAMVNAMAELDVPMQKPVSLRGRRLLKEGGPKGKHTLQWRKVYYRASSRRQDGWDWDGNKGQIQFMNMCIAGSYIDLEESMLIAADRALSSFSVEAESVFDDVEEWEMDRAYEDMYLR